MNEDLACFFDDFGVPTGSDGKGPLVLLDMPGQEALGGRILTTEYLITYIANQLTLSSGDLITVEGDLYKVRQDLPLEDGAFRSATLSKQ